MLYAAAFLLRTRQCQSECSEYQGVMRIIHIIVGGAGAGKSTQLIQEIQTYLRSESHVLTLVPEQFSYEYDRKLYQLLGAGAFNRLETHSFKSLARALFQRYGFVPDGKSNADEFTQTALLYQAAMYTADREKSLQILGKQCRQNSFIEELRMVISQLRRSGITPDKLYQCCGSLNGRLLEKTMDLFRIYQSYDRLLEEHQLKDIETELTEAAAVANGQDAFLGDILFIDEFESFTEDEYELMNVLFASCQEVYIALRTEDTAQQEFSLFETVNHTMHRIQRMGAELHVPVQVQCCDTAYRFQHEELAWLSRHVFRTAAPYHAEASHLHILEALTPNEEAEYVCATIRWLLQSDSTLRCSDIAVLSNKIADYQSILETTMERYALPYHMDEKRSVLHMPLMVYLFTVLELICSKNPDTELLLRLGKTGLTACSMMEIAELENYCYTWQIDGETWNHPFTGGNCTAAEAIRQKLSAPLNQLKQRCVQPQTGQMYCQILYDFLTENHIQEQLSQKLCQIPEELQRSQTAEDWAFVWNSFVDILDHLAALYSDMLLEIGEFSSVLRAMLSSVQRAVPPRTLDAVLISQGSTARLNAPKVVFILGVCEDVFPAKAGGNSIFSEKDCAALEQFELPLVKSKAAQSADARLAAYKLLSASSHALYLTYPTADVSHQRCYPAAVLTQIQRMFPNAPTQKQTCAQQGSAYYAASMHAAYYRYMQDYAEHSSDTVSIEQVLMEDSFYRERLMALQELTQRYTEQKDKPLFRIEHPQRMEAFLGDSITLSASSLEEFQLCPFCYFCHRILRLFKRQRVQLTGFGAGSLVHDCLEQLLRQYDKESFLQLTPEQLQTLSSTYAAHYWEEQMGGDFSKSSREMASYRKTVNNMQQLLLHLQEEFRQTAFYPGYLELAITPQQPDFPSPMLYTAQGKQVCLVGKIDRVDLCRDEDALWVRVVDYKTDGKQFRLGNLLYGLDMQMLIYLFSITEKGTALSDASPAGVLYLPAGGVECNLERDGKKTPLAKCNETYRMNGILLKNPRLIQLMEQECGGIYIPAKLDANGQICVDSRKKDGVFLTQKQMQLLRDYVYQKLTNTAEQIYSGEIDAAPLLLSGRESCTYCAYANICGNSDMHHRRSAEGDAKSREQQMMERLSDENGEKEADA